MHTLLSLFLLALVPQAHAQGLTKEEKLALLKEAQNVLVESESALLKATSETHKILKAAANDKQKCLELYYDAIKEVNFASKGKSSGDFKAWKTANKNRISDKSSLFVIQPQVRWLNFSLISNNIKDPSIKRQFTTELIAFLDDFYKEIEEMNKNGKGLNANVENGLKKKPIGTEIATYLSLRFSTNKNWPESPTQLDKIYGDLIFPFVKEQNNIQLLKTAWEKRIKQQSTYISATSSIKKNGLRGADTGLANRQFNEQKKPKLIWSMCLDLYEHGAQQETSELMLNHIRNNRSHPDAPKWAEELITLLTPEEDL